MQNIVINVWKVSWQQEQQQEQRSWPTFVAKMLKQIRLSIHIRYLSKVRQRKADGLQPTKHRIKCHE